MKPGSYRTYLLGTVPTYVVAGVKAANDYERHRTTWAKVSLALIDKVGVLSAGVRHTASYSAVRTCLIVNDVTASSRPNRSSHE